MVFKVVFYSTKPYDETFFTKAQQRWKESAGLDVQFVFHQERLTIETCSFAQGFDAICIFVNDNATDKSVLKQLAAYGIKLILLRCAGFNNVDMKTARQHDILVMRVPRYSPHAVAEHACALLMGLTRKLHKAHGRIAQHDFSLQGLEGFDVYSRNVGVIGTGAIGKIFAGIMRGFGCPVFAFDPKPDQLWAKNNGIVYVPIEEIWARSDIISLHVPLTKDNKHIINQSSISQMKRGVTIINTSRGGLIDTQAAVDGLLSGKIKALGIDVYENETPYFFGDHSLKPMEDRLLAQLISFPNVLMTGHQAFFTADALTAISDTTFANIDSFLKGNAVKSPNECSGAKDLLETSPALKMPHNHEKLLTAKL